MVAHPQNHWVGKVKPFPSRTTATRADLGGWRSLYPAAMACPPGNIFCAHPWRRCTDAWRIPGIVRLCLPTWAKCSRGINFSITSENCGTRYPQIHFSRIFHYQPSSYWGTPMTMETSTWLLTLLMIFVGCPCEADADASGCSVSLGFKAYPWSSLCNTAVQIE